MTMPTSSTPRRFERDGTSQAGRESSSLAPGSVALDERTLPDLLAFTDALARELVYVDMANLPAGDWRGLLHPGGEGAGPDLDAIARFVADPSGVDDESPLRRPQLVLFLAFLHLLGIGRERINRLAGAHLDYYYGRFLALQKKPATADTVDVVASLAPGAGPTLLPQGTLLDAGKDSQGGALVYRTDADLVVNRAQVADLYTVFVDKRVTGLREAREACVASGDDPRLAMFELVYGDPLHDTALPAYPVAGRPLDAALVDEIGAMIAFVGSRLYLDQAEFARLMLLKNRRQQAAPADWRLINAALAAMGKAALHDPAFAIVPPDSPAFWANVNKAFNGKLPKFASLPGNVTGFDDLYDSYLQNPGQGDTLAFIQNKLHLEPAAFAALMAAKQAVDSDWRIVNGLLEAAGQRMRGDPDYRLLQDDDADPYRRASTAFDANLEAALGTPDFSPFHDLFSGDGTELDRFDAALERVRAYFFCTLDEVGLLVRTVPGADPAPADWERCYAILAAAYARKVYAQRLQALHDSRAGLAPKAGLEAMLRVASGQGRLSIDELLAMLAAWWPAADTGMALYKRIQDQFALPAAPPFADWDAAAACLELAWRAREGRPPVAQREQWLLLHASTDATARAAAQPGDTPRWPTFGQLRESPPRTSAPPAHIGWSLASPVLCLSGGERQVVLTLVFAPEGFAGKIAAMLAPAEAGAAVDPADWPFRVEASSAGGWIAPTQLTIAAGEQPPLPSGKVGKTLVFTLRFAASAPAVAALPGGPSPWPMLRLLLQPSWQAASARWETPYPLFRALVLERVLLAVAVQGLAGLALANDDGAFPSGSPFEPFGSSPASGSAFRFTHAELAGKRLHGMQIKLQWMKLPAADLAAHYANYGAFITANKDFSARLGLLDHGEEIPLVAKAQLFDAADAGKPRAIVLDDVAAAARASRPGYLYTAEHAPLDPAAPAAWPRGWRLELNDPDFQHGRYPSVVAAKSIELAAAMTACLRPGSTANVPDPALYKVNPPCTPKLKSFGVDYDCAVTVVMDAADPLGYGGGEERIFHHHVFGVAPIVPDAASGQYALLPAYDNEGELYLGLDEAGVPGDVAILFQMAEGSAAPDLPARQLRWDVLDGERWRSMDGAILADGTRGLAQSGIIRFRLPEARPGSILPAGRYWLRAALDRDTDSVCDCIAIRAQAVSASWLARPATAGHLDAPLAAGTIVKTVAPLPGIAAIVQPYTSAGGKPAEDDALFRRRVSERLRHKQRALSAWDYEHLLLERFPAIYKAKCIPVASSDAAGLGKVDVIVIPDVRGQLPFNPFAPKATVGQLAAMNDFIAGQVSPLAEVTVRNARYVAVRVRVAVRFLPGHEPGFYKARLNEGLNRFLSPWAYDRTSEMVIGGTIYASPIIDFLERQDGVDYVAALKLFKNEDGLSFTPVADDGDGYRVQAGQPDAVLVADLQHEIDVIGDTPFEDADASGIGYMKIALDFIVA